MTNLNTELNTESQTNTELNKLTKADIYRQRQQDIKDAQQQLMIDALKSNLSDYAIRVKQSEELAGVLLAEKLTKEELLTELFKLVPQHMQEKANERAVYQQQLLQTTALAVNNLCTLKPDADHDVDYLRTALQHISKALAVALGNMTDFEKKATATNAATSEAVNKDSSVDQSIQTTEQS